ncbi:MAG: hypothetical protein AAFN09_10905 [Pseudomonadota bacterium]
MREIFWICMVMVILSAAGTSSEPQAQMLEAELALPDFLRSAEAQVIAR